MPSTTRGSTGPHCPRTPPALAAPLWVAAPPPRYGFCEARLPLPQLRRSWPPRSPPARVLGFSDHRCTWTGRALCPLLRRGLSRLHSEEVGPGNPSSLPVFPLTPEDLELVVREKPVPPVVAPPLAQSPHWGLAALMNSSQPSSLFLLGRGVGKRGIGYPAALKGLPAPPPPDRRAPWALVHVRLHTSANAESAARLCWVRTWLVAQLHPAKVGTGWWCWSTLAYMVHSGNSPVGSAFHELKPGTLGPMVTLHVPPGS